MESSTGKIEGPARRRSSEPPDILTQFASQTELSYSALFTFAIQPLNPELSDSIIHVIPGTVGKGNKDVEAKSVSFDQRHSNQFRFDIASLALDGSRYFNAWHGDS
jgi:hypothetical protein